MRLTPIQHRVLQVIHRSPNGRCELTRLGRLYKAWPGKLGDPVLGRLAAYATAMALKRRGLVCFIRSSPDQWGRIIVCCTRDGDVEAWTPMRPPCRTKKLTLSDVSDIVIS